MASACQNLLSITIAFSFALFGEPAHPPVKPSVHPKTNHSLPPLRSTPPGNAITQSFMSVPALLVDFPKPASPDHPAAVRRLARQWRVFWAVGNAFFRPISNLGVANYAYAAWKAHSSSSSASNDGLDLDWRLLALATACHVVTVVHSAAYLQPINARLMALEGAGLEEGSVAGAADVVRAEGLARRWARLNLLRMVMPLVAGSVALLEMTRHR